MKTECYCEKAEAKKIDLPVSMRKWTGIYQFNNLQQFT